MTLFGGVSAAYNAQDNDHVLSLGGFSKDGFSVNNVIVGLTKPAQDGGIGFTAAFGSWEAPTVVASSDVVNGRFIGLNLIGHGKTTEFKPWLAFVTYKPVAGLSVDAGLLWANFGERPVTILNPHITRGVLFTANPVVMAGARASYDAGIAKVYVGTGKVGAQLMKPFYENFLIVIPKTYIEAGITGNLKQVGLPVDVGLHTYNEAGGRDIYALTAGGDLGIVSLGLEVNYFKADKVLKAAQGNSDSAWGAALCANVKPMAGIQIPVRIEYADAKKSQLIPTIADTINGNSVWTFTITPTYNPTKNTFIRAEVSYVNSDKNIFVNDKGNPKDSRTTGAVELGFLF
ncbi:outer membrane beta-barrel protein [Sulfurihydrogenibium azorense]|uniref:outer membrane beta-barrel protein n=1 Tax=Sulfurihydrogenibium azorense TaxID=309806 RepID=UPI001E2A669E|nr:outer membrane beta-barrel protein [Sulfurihydrogenibium azorense]